MQTTRFPAGICDMNTHGCTFARWPVSGLAERPLRPSRKREPSVVCAQELKPVSVKRPLRPPYRCGGSADSENHRLRVTSFCFPFNCAGMNAGTGTNSAIVREGCRLQSALTPRPHRSAMSKIEELADRVDRLLLRHEELQRTNALLEQQLGSVTHERDNLRSRLNAARSRIDALLERLPTEPAPGHDSKDAESAEGAA